MKKITNPYIKISGYNCFGCSHKNDLGLKLNFTETEEGLICHWMPEDHFQGWMGVLHGGIQATLLDEIASWVVFVKCEISGVTSELKVRYKKAVQMNKSPLRIEGKLREMQRNIAIIDCYLYDSEGVLCAQAECKYFTFSDEISRNEYFYPGKDAFYED